MLDKDQATTVVQNALPKGRIQACVEYKDLYLFQVFGDEEEAPGESEMDPFFSVNKGTGEFKEFSIITDGNIREVNALFMQAKGGE